jgi:AmmeMemoRadiSam system protein B
MRDTPTRDRVRHGHTRLSTYRKCRLQNNFRSSTHGADPQRKRIFLLGPSHHHSLATIAFPEVTTYTTPLSDDPLPLDSETISNLRSSSSSFETMSRRVDEREHSMELHLPYIHRRLQLEFPDRPTSQYPPLVPIMVGSTSADTERAVGTLLAPYLADPCNVFLISSDFCHWGSRFGYTYYVPHAPQQRPPLPLSHTHLPQPPTTIQAAEEAFNEVSSGRSSLTRNNELGKAEIYDSISAVDIATMKAITTGTTGEFLKILRSTGNTVCGRHPIGVMMAALEEVAATSSGSGEVGKFHFIRYERSSDPDMVSESSVSYVSAVAVA